MLVLVVVHLPAHAETSFRELAWILPTVGNDPIENTVSVETVDSHIVYSFRVKDLIELREYVGRAYHIVEVVAACSEKEKQCDFSKPYILHVGGKTVELTGWHFALPSDVEVEISSTPGFLELSGTWRSKRIRFALFASPEIVQAAEKDGSSAVGFDGEDPYHITWGEHRFAIVYVMQENDRPSGKTKQEIQVSEQKRDG